MENRKCHWCRTEVRPGRNSRVMVVETRKFYFHGKCLVKFKEHNPNTWRRNLEEALQRNF